MAEEAQQKWGYSPDLSIFQSLRVWAPWGEGFEGSFCVEYVPGDQDSAWHKGSTQEVILSEWISHPIRQTVHLGAALYYSHSHSSVCLWPALLGHPPTECPSSLPRCQIVEGVSSKQTPFSTRNLLKMTLRWSFIGQSHLHRVFGSALESQPTASECSAEKPPKPGREI